jgi:type IV pilus assembly protein PilA
VTRHPDNDAGFTLIELLVAVGTVAILAAIALPNVLRARIAANEASALASLRVIHTAQSTFASECGGNGYAQRLADLIKPPAGSSHAFISPDLGNDPTLKSGYVITVEEENAAGAVDMLPAGASCNASNAATVSTYWAGAAPLHVGITGQRAFAIDRTGVIYQNVGGAAIANPIPPGTAHVQ